MTGGSVSEEDELEGVYAGRGQAHLWVRDSTENRKD